MGVLNIAPTPWRVGPVDDTVVSAADRSVVAEVDGDYNQPDEWPVMEANARLIAAAPDLYSATTAWITYLDTQSEFGTAAEEEAMLDAMRVALAKARGDQ
jgi:hypothetical protein